jgi:hypothetical protein
MEDRGFSEVDLRGMLEAGARLRRDVAEGRYRVETALRERLWEVVVEPDFSRRVLVVVTAFSVEPR